jgi:hypothetical protein
MSTRSHATAKKRQRELARMERQREKIAKRMQRKIEKLSPGLEEGADQVTADQVTADQVTADQDTSGGPSEPLMNTTEQR